LALHFPNKVYRIYSSSISNAMVERFYINVIISPCFQRDDVVRDGGYQTANSDDRDTLDSSYDETTY